MKSYLYCASCGRKEGSGPDDVIPISYINQKWCSSCAAIGYTHSGSAYVEQPSPGLMIEGPTSDPLVAWNDCYSTTPKKRIRKAKAKTEIQRVWANWNGDKSHNSSMFEFYSWLTRFRPYFLTFRCQGDPWQTIHSWLLQYERGDK